MKPINRSTRIGLFIVLGALLIASAVYFIKGIPSGLIRRPELDYPVTRADWQKKIGDPGSLATMYRTIILVEKTYLDASRINPRAMLLGAMHNIQLEIPQLITEERGDQLIVRTDNAEKAFALDDITSVWTLLQRMRDVFDFIRKSVNPADIVLSEVEYQAINGMLSTLDPHSVLLSPAIYRDMMDHTQGNFGGIGIQIAIRDGALTIISPIDNTPATRVGLKSGDQILRIDEASTVNMPINDAVLLMRGRPGTTVTLHILRKEWQEPRQFKITRDIIEVRSVESALTPRGIGYVRVSDFQSNTASALLEAIAKMERKSPLNGLVLDLRDNPGGLLSAAIEVSDVFLKSGVIVTTAGQSLEMREVRQAMDQGFEPSWPVVVLVNEGSASASEIVAGALKNHNRAVIVGARTFGKGSVQTLHDFPDGSALKITSAQYLTPGDLSIQSVGIAPHVAIQAILADQDVIDLKERIQLRENDLTRSLVNGSNGNAGHADNNEIVTLSHLEEKKPSGKKAPSSDDDEDAPADSEENSIRFVYKSDFNIELAQDMVLHMSKNRLTSFNAVSFQPLFEARRQVEDARLLTAMAKLGVDWAPSDGTDSAPVLDTAVALSASFFAADSRGEVSVSVTNNSNTPVYRVLALTRSDYPPLDQRELAIGKILPGQTITRTLPFRVSQSVWTATYDVRVSLETPLKTDFSRHAARFSVEAAKNPAFAFATQFLDTAKGNGDGRLQIGEEGTLLCWIRNDGPGKAPKGYASIKNLSGNAVFLSKGRAELKEILPGAIVPAPFQFQVKKAFAKTAVEFELSIMDTILKSYTGEKILIPVLPPIVVAPIDERVQLNATAPFFANASADAEPLGTAPAGSVFTATGITPSRLRVRYDDTVSVWINNTDATTIASTTDSDAPPIAPDLQRTFNAPPVITLVEPPPGVVQSEEIVLRGVARDDRRVRDLYILWSQDKVFFKAAHAAGEKELPFEARIKLRNGLNYISIVAEENGTLDTNEVYVIRRDGPDGMPWVRTYDLENKSEPLGVIPSLVTAPAVTAPVAAP